jgi:hypothetical protein
LQLIFFHYFYLFNFFILWIKIFVLFMMRKTTIPRPEPPFTQSLKFATTAEKPGENGRPARRTFERQVSIIYWGIKNDLHKYQVFCADARFRFERTSEPYHELIRDIGFVFGQLALSSNEQGLLVRLHNFPFLQYRWKQLREKLHLNYEGAVFMQYITPMDQLMSDYDATLAYLQLPDMYGLYFNGYLGEYQNDAPSRQVFRCGPEAGAMDIEETIILSQTRDNGAQRQIQLEMTGKPVRELPSWQGYQGSCCYLDGVPDHCRKEINMGSEKIIYSATWAGLKTYFR